MGERSGDTVIVNGRAYRFPAMPVVVICIGGSEPGYIERAVEAGFAPNLARLMAEGANLSALAVVPSVTLPNIASILTGRAPAIHGLAGNCMFERERGAAIEASDPRLMRVPTILRAFYNAGARIAAVTARDEQRALLGHRLDFASGRAIVFSAEGAGQTSLATHGIEAAAERIGLPQPALNAAELSEFVLAAGLSLLGRERPDLMFLATGDDVQHRAGPGSEAANAFYAMLDRYVGALDRLGCVLALTADHGMNDKHSPNGAPDVTYVQDAVDAWMGPDRARVVLPIARSAAPDSMLGSCAMIYLAPGEPAAPLLARLNGLEGIDLALDRVQACARLELPADRIGDIVLTATLHKVLALSRKAHDLSRLPAPLRSHGGLTEETVPMILNRPTTLPEGRRLRNFDVFDLALNHVR